MIGVMKNIQSIEQVAFTNSQTSTANVVVSFILQSVIQSIAMVAGTAVAKMLFTKLLPFDPAVYSREGFETRRALVLMAFLAAIITVMRFLYPAGLPLALGGTGGPSSSGQSSSTVTVPGGSGVGSVPPRPTLAPEGDKSLARDSIPNARMFF